jgi:transcriptional regulator with XRE-family HTH domain
MADVATEKIYPLTSDLIEEGMKNKKMSIKDLAIKIDTTYEHVRRLVNGQALPSKFTLKEICNVLGLSYKEAERAATSDRITKKFGTIPLELSGKKPGLAPIERVWDNLTEDQQADVVTMVQGWSKRNKALGVGKN